MAVPDIAPGVIIRINPKQCDYSKLDPEGDEFVSKAPELGGFGIGRGTLVYAIASGTNRKAGLLGIWTASCAPINRAAEDKDVKSFNEPYKTKRKTVQWRIPADICHDEFEKNNLDTLKGLSFAHYLNEIKPMKLTREQVIEINDEFGVCLAV
jgi:hypothetical protein